MILTAHQPGYIPWIGLFHKIALADHFISFNQVQYEVKGWHNRNRIKTNAGAIWLSVPVLSKGHLTKKLSDIEISNNEPWAKKHYRSIFLAYSKAPYWKRYADFFEEVYLKRTWGKLVDLNEFMLRWFLGELGIKTTFSTMDSYDFQGKKSDLVLDMCIKTGANSYIFGALGRDYADVKSFLDSGVTPFFQDYKHPVYNQLHGDFISHMSIIDLLVMYGCNSFDILMEGNDLKIGHACT